MKPEDVLKIVQSIDSQYTHICEASNSLFACYNPFFQDFDEVWSAKGGTFRFLNVKVDWPNPNNKIYPEITKSKKVKLNSEYTANVYKDKVVVDCQTFTKEKIEELYNTMKSLE